MGKNSQYARPNEEQMEYERRKKPNPVWRGVGFILMVVVPVLSYLAALYILDQNNQRHWFALPTDILIPWGSDPLIAIKILITIILTIIVFMVIFLIGVILYQVFGPPRYGPLDSPPLSRDDIMASAVRRRTGRRG